MSSESRVRKRISPIHTNSGSAVSVHDEAEPQMVTAIASPAGRDEKSSIPIHATPDSARPIHTPLPSSANSATISRVVMSASRGVAIRCAAARPTPAAAASEHLQHELVHERDQEHQRAEGHGELRNPQRRGVVAVEMSLKSHDCQARRTL